MAVDSANYQSSAAGQKSQYQRALQDWYLQANTAGFEISSIDKQITGANIHIALANKDILMQQTQIDQAKEIDGFLQQKYSNAELYIRMDGQTKTLFYNTYTEAMNMASKAQKAFDLVRPHLPPNQYIQPGYWDATRDGMLAGETLYLALKRLEAASLDDRGYNYEITKSISLRQLNATALFNLRELGTCSFSIPEVLFDMDFPGHYVRRIKSVSVTIPCLVGPYTSVNATLSLRSSKIRVVTTPSSSSSGGDPYAEDPNAANGLDPRFVVGNVPIHANAVSNAQNDAGAFQLDFSEQATRYLPFEGAGVVSSWQLALPPYPTFRQFTYQSITDVILQIRYTSVEGGSALSKLAQAYVESFLKTVDSSTRSGGLMAMFDLKNEFASSWSRLANAAGVSGQTAGDASATTTKDTVALLLDLPDLNTRLPIYVQTRSPKQIQATDVWVFAAGLPIDNKQTPPPPSLQLPPSTDSQTFSAGSPLGDLASAYNFHLDSSAKPTPVGSWKIVLDKELLSASRCWMVIQYMLT